MDRIVFSCRLLFAVAIGCLGVEHFVWAMFGNPAAPAMGDLKFVPIMPFVPLLSGNPALLYFTGVVLLVVGVSMAARQHARLAAIFTGLFFFACAALFEGPRMIAAPADIVARTNFFQVLSLGAAGFMLAGILAAGSQNFLDGNPAVQKLIQLAPLLLGFSSIVFGIDHFLNPNFIARLVPAWIPFPSFWAWFTGVAFVAAGLAIVAKRLDQWAGFWLGIMFLLWVALLHVPSLTRFPNSHDPDEWSNVFIVLGMCAASWMCALGAQCRLEQKVPD